MMKDAKTLFTKDHEWIQWNGTTAIVGITQHAADALGDIVFVDLPEIDRHYEQNDPCSVVESVKAASDVYAPVSGKITQVNDSLRDDPSLINKDPTLSGWFWIMDISHLEQLDDLLTAEQYQELLDKLT